MKKAKPKYPCASCKGTGEVKQRKGPAHICHDCNGTGRRRNMRMMVWHYPSFPYALAAIGFMEDNGLAYIPSYNSYFRPFLILDLKEGAILKRKLEDLADDHAQAHAMLKKGFDAQLQTICPKALQN